MTDVDDPSRYGLVRLYDNGRVEAFVEKPSADQLRPGEPFRINAGTYLFGPEILAEIPAGVANCSIERDVFPRLAEADKLAGFPATAYWLDIGTPESVPAGQHRRARRGRGQRRSRSATALSAKARRSPQTR